MQRRRPHEVVATHSTGEQRCGYTGQASNQYLIAVCDRRGRGAGRRQVLSGLMSVSGLKTSGLMRVDCTLVPRYYSLELYV